VLAAYDRVLGHRQNNLLLLSLAGVTLASALASAVRQQRERELADVRTVAEVAQKVLLRPVPRWAGPIRVAVSYTSAAAEARIGGDLYEVVTSPLGVRILVATCRARACADGDVRFVEFPEPAPPLGIRDLYDVKPQAREVAFAPGDQMLFYTDGVIEARDRDGRSYPLQDRAFLLTGKGAEHALEDLRADLVRHVGGPVADDAAMLLIRHL
jgi:serine phosphatase RsbU (regulator of sigma subunit)